MISLILGIVAALLTTNVQASPAFAQALSNASLPCNGPIALAARFRFLANTAEAFFHIQNGWVYFEYIIPRLFFSGIGATIQTGNTCMDCINANASTSTPLVYDDNLVFTKCKFACFDNNQFVIAGRGDPTTSEVLSWIIENIQFSSGAGIPNMASPTAILGPADNARLGGEFRNPGKRIFDFNGISYIHISWYREWQSSNGDQWQVPLNGAAPLCWTWTVGEQRGLFDPNRATITSLDIAAARGGVVCQNVTVVCTPQPTGQPTKAPVPAPTAIPTPAPTLQPIPNLLFKIPDDLCLFPRNFSLNIILDGSKSIADDSYIRAKQWAGDVMNATVRLADQLSTRVSAFVGFPINLCVRTSVMTFAVDNQIVWNLDGWGECLTLNEVDAAVATLLAAPRPDPNGSRLRGTHTADALHKWVSMVYTNRKANESTIVLMATDGLPKSILRNGNQSPCTSQGAGILQSTFSSTSTRFFLVGIGFNIGNIEPFRCLERNYPVSEWLVSIDRFVDLQETNLGISNSILGELCGVRDVKCDYPLFETNTSANSTNPIPNNAFNQTIPATDFGIQFEPLNKDVWVDNFTLTVFNNCSQTAVVMEAQIWETDTALNQDTLLATSYNVTVPFYNLSLPRGLFTPSIFFKFLSTDPQGNEFRMRAGRGYIYTFVFRIIQGIQCQNDVMVTCVNLTSAQNFTDPNPIVGVQPVTIRVLDGVRGAPPSVTPVPKMPAITICVLDLLPIQTAMPTVSPSLQPSRSPSTTPTRAPSASPTRTPTDLPTISPSLSPSRSPSITPTAPPSVTPTKNPTQPPSVFPTDSPSKNPTKQPTLSPSRNPSTTPTKDPSVSPSASPSLSPTLSPSQSPSLSPSRNPSVQPTGSPSKSPSNSPTKGPSAQPSKSPSSTPSVSPTENPSSSPSSSPSTSPTKSPSLSPSMNPSLSPTSSPTPSPTHSPSKNPSISPSVSPSNQPTRNPSVSPTESPTDSPTKRPTSNPSFSPSNNPSSTPTSQPSKSPSANPSVSPSLSPSQSPTMSPSRNPSQSPSASPSNNPSTTPTKTPSANPTAQPTNAPSQDPSVSPSRNPSTTPTFSPSDSPTQSPTVCTGPPPDYPRQDCLTPASNCNANPVVSVNPQPSVTRVMGDYSQFCWNYTLINPLFGGCSSVDGQPVVGVSFIMDECCPDHQMDFMRHVSLNNQVFDRNTCPLGNATTAFSSNCVRARRLCSTRTHTDMQCTVININNVSEANGTFCLMIAGVGFDMNNDSLIDVNKRDTAKFCFERGEVNPIGPNFCSCVDVDFVTSRDVCQDTNHPTPSPTVSPTKNPSVTPTKQPSISPTTSPSQNPSTTPTKSPSNNPSGSPTSSPTANPTRNPSNNPSASPSNQPSTSPTKNPSASPSVGPTTSPSRDPSVSPSMDPSKSPSNQPTKNPSLSPSSSPSTSPTENPSNNPSMGPTSSPSTTPSKAPTMSPSANPSAAPSTNSPSSQPTSSSPSASPSYSPSISLSPSLSPSSSITGQPKIDPSRSPSTAPTTTPSTTSLGTPTMSVTPSPSQTPSRTTPSQAPSGVTPSQSPSAATPSQTPSFSGVTPSQAPTGVTPTRTPSALTPTRTPTAAPSTCPKPPMFKPKMCTSQLSAMDVEWQVRGQPVYGYDARRDMTQYVYTVCTLRNKPSSYPGPITIPRPLDSFWLQVGCKCEICLDDVTVAMKPSGRVNNYMQTWRWDVQVVPGECVEFTFKLDGYVPPIMGTYIVASYHECAAGAVLVPDPCGASLRHTVLPTPAPTQCTPRYPAFPKHCMSVCHAWDAEWAISFVDRSVVTNNQTNETTTTFAYKASVRGAINNRNETCYYPGKGPQPLEEIHIRLPCDCDPDRGFIQRQIVDIEPVGFVDELSFSWYPRHLVESETMMFTIVLAGDVPQGLGDVSAGGDMRCLVHQIEAPNLCGTYTPPPPKHDSHRGWNNDRYYDSSSSSSSSGGTWGRYRNSRSRRSSSKRSYSRRTNWP